jgi:hypothetical protein
MEAGTVLTGVNIMKKTYSTPVLRSQQIRLGVFGDYGQDGGHHHRDHDAPPQPLRVVGSFDLHLD